MRSPGSGKNFLTFWIGLTAVAVGAAVVVWQLPQNNPPPATNNDSARMRYAAFYQAAWRQDNGRGSTTMTATLLVPPAVTALGQDTSRSSAEEQLWELVKKADPKYIPVLVTVDSIEGAIPDAELHDKLTLTADGGPKLTAGDWQPMIAPTRIVNTNQPTSSQIGLVMFRAEQEIDWTGLGSLQLTVKDIGDQPRRIFTWVKPSLLLEL